MAKTAVRSRKKRDPAIDAYLATVGAPNRRLLEQLRKTIHAIAPRVEECISYRLPAFRLDGKIVAGFAATAKGCSYYPFSGRTLVTLAREVEEYRQTKGALHFGPARALPAALIRKLVAARIAETGPR